MLDLGSVCDVLWAHCSMGEKRILGGGLYS